MSTEERPVMRSGLPAEGPVGPARRAGSPPQTRALANRLPQAVPEENRARAEGQIHAAPAASTRAECTAQVCQREKSSRLPNNLAAGYVLWVRDRASNSCTLILVIVAEIQLLNTDFVFDVVQPWNEGARVQYDDSRSVFFILNVNNFFAKDDGALVWNIRSEYYVYISV